MTDSKEDLQRWLRAFAIIFELRACQTFLRKPTAIADRLYSDMGKPYEDYALKFSRETVNEQYRKSFKKPNKRAASAMELPSNGY